MKPPTPVAWFFGVTLFWIVFCPLYLYYLSRYATKNLVGAGLLTALIFCSGTGYIYFR